MRNIKLITNCERPPNYLMDISVKHWLKKYNIDKYIKDVTYNKPNALFYIDDKAITFNNWNNTLKHV